MPFSVVVAVAGPSASQGNDDVDTTVKDDVRNYCYVPSRSPFSAERSSSGFSCRYWVTKKDGKESPCASTPASPTTGGTGLATCPG